MDFVIAFQEKKMITISSQTKLNVNILFPDIDDCIDHTCSNGGSCIDGVNNYSCNCLVGFTGNYCETGKSFFFSFLFFSLLFNFSCFGCCCCSSLMSPM